MFRQFFDTSFHDYRQVRVVLQELPHDPSKKSSTDFQRFCTCLLNHKTFTYEQFKIEYCFVKESLIIAETSLTDIQLYRRPFAYLFFTVCHTSEQLRIVLDVYAKIKQREKGVYVHLFVRYRINDDDEEDDLSNDDQLSNGYNHRFDQTLSSRPSLSSIDYDRMSSQIKLQDSSSIDGSLGSDRISLTDSVNSVAIFSAISTDHDDSAVGIRPRSSTELPKLSKFSLFKDKNIAAVNIFQTFDGDLARVLQRLEANLTKHVLESERYRTFESREFENYASRIDSQLADIRLMIDCERDCSLFEQPGKSRYAYQNDRIFQTVLTEFDMRVMFIVLTQYVKANANLTMESGKNKLSKKIIDTRTIKRRADCCLLLGAIEKAYTDYRSVAETLKSQNDMIWHAAALEARIAASYASSQKPKRQLQKSLSFLKENSLHRIEKYFNRSNTPMHLQDRMDQTLQIYGAANRTAFNKVTFRLELDICLRWCSLLWEQNDAQKYRNDIDQYIIQINRLGSYLEEHIDSIYLNAYLADTYAFIGLKRKSALYYRCAAFSGLTLLSEHEGYNDEINFFAELIKKARAGYGIDDNQLIFPLIQKTIINESIRISLKNDDFTTIIENVHFAIESLIEHMSNPELEALLTFLNATEESITCSYCSIPRLKSLDLLPLPNRLKVWIAGPRDGPFLYHRLTELPRQHQSLHRKVDFYWVKNEAVQIELEVENNLPATMVIDQFEFLTDNPLQTKLETKYRVSARTKKRLLIDCIPKESGQLRIQGLRYHTWSTNQEFRFGDFSTIRQCACAIDVVNELPILDLQYLIINQKQMESSGTSMMFKAQVYRGEDIFVTLGLHNSSNECSINTLEVQAYFVNRHIRDDMKLTALDLPIRPGQSIEPKLDLTAICDHCLARQDRANLDTLTIELRLNYSNELPDTYQYYRRNTIELCLNYSSAVTFQINDIQNDEDDLSYLMLCTIENHLSERIRFENHVIKPSESSVIPLKQEKIKLNTFPSNVNQLINGVRTQLPTHIHYKTIDSDKHLRLPIDWQYFSNDRIQNHANMLIQSPFTCSWHFQRIVNTLHRESPSEDESEGESENEISPSKYCAQIRIRRKYRARKCPSTTLHIYLCVISKLYKLEKLEFQFPLIPDVQYLNSNKIRFNNIEPGEYFMAERVLVFSKEISSNMLMVDVIVNGIAWKSITLTF